MTDDQQVWTLGKATEYLERERGIEIKTVTLRSWFNELEKLKVHTLPRTENKRERVLTRNELDIAVFIYETRQLYGKKLSSEVIANMVKNNEKLQNHFIEDDGSDNSELLNMDHLIARLTEEMNERLSEIRDEIRQEYAEKEEQTRLALPDSTDQLNDRLTEIREEIRQEYANREEQARLAQPDPSVKAEEERIALRTFQINIWDAERRVRRELAAEAELKWNENPIKTGFIIKKEDTAKKLEFINLYIEERLGESVKALIKNS